MDLLEPVGRSERRHWGAVYIRGLLLNGERKSIEPLADRSNEGNVQALQQFVGQSPWDWMPLWERLGKRMTAELEPDPVWVIDDTGFPKQGKHSVGVERQYSGTLSKVGNCQVAVSLHHVGEQGSTVIGWRLYLPESWTKDDKRREEAGIPEEVVCKTKWQLSLDMIDQVRAWGLPNRIVVADAGYGDTTEFREELEARQLPYVVGISSTTGVWSKPPNKHKFLATRGAALHRRATPMENSGRRPRRTRRSKRRVGRGFAGGKAQKDGWNRASWPYEYNLLMASSVGNHRTRQSGY